MNSSKPESGEGYAGIREAFFSNLLLLGFHPSQLETTYKAKFSQDMFLVPNTKCFQVVIFFLFEKLNSDKAVKHFQTCYPVRDKKDEQNFRRACNSWMTEISQTDPNAHLPRITPSLFVTPGGEGFYNLMFSFSMHVLMKDGERLGLKGSKRLQYPVLNAELSGLSKVMRDARRVATIRERGRLLQKVDESSILEKEWTSAGREMVKDYRELKTKEQRLETKLQSVTSGMKNRGGAVASLLLKGRSLSPSQHRFDTETVKRELSRKYFLGYLL